MLLWGLAADKILDGIHSIPSAQDSSDVKSAIILHIMIKFTIYDSVIPKHSSKNILKELNLDDKQFQPNIIQAHISSAKGPAA